MSKISLNVASRRHNEQISNVLDYASVTSELLQRAEEAEDPTELLQQARKLISQMRREASSPSPPVPSWKFVAITVLGDATRVTSALNNPRLNP